MDVISTTSNTLTSNEEIIKRTEEEKYKVTMVNIEGAVHDLEHQAQKVSDNVVSILMNDFGLNEVKGVAPIGEQSGGEKLTRLELLRNNLEQTMGHLQNIDHFLNNVHRLTTLNEQPVPQKSR